jgi:hypothetical protein
MAASGRSYPTPHGNSVVLIGAAAGVAGLLAVVVLSTGSPLVEVTSPTANNPPKNPSMVMQNSGWSSGIEAVGILSVSNGNNLSPSDLTFTVEAAGVLYYSGAAGLNDSRGGPIVDLRYHDAAPVGTVSAGDAFGVRVVPDTSTALSEATVKVFKGGLQLGVVTLAKVTGPTTVILQGSGWNNGNNTVSIASVTNGNGLAPSDLTYTIETTSGPYYSGSAGANDTRGGPLVNVVYNDLTGANLVTAGDSIRVHITPSSSMALAGASLKVFSGGSQICTVVLG